MPQQTPNVFTYPRGEPGTLGHLDLIEPLRSLPRELDTALKGASDAMLEWREGDEWSIHLIVGHLRDGVEIFHKRLYMISTQTDPIMPAWDEVPEDEARFLAMPIDETLRSIRDWRAMTTQLLTSLVNWNWARTGQHLEMGRMSIRQVVEYMVDHEGQHLAEVRRLRAAAEAAVG